MSYSYSKYALLNNVLLLFKVKAAGSGAASTAMAVPLFLKLKKTPNKLTQTQHSNNVQYCTTG